MNHVEPGTEKKARRRKIVLATASALAILGPTAVASACGVGSYGGSSRDGGDRHRSSWSDGGHRQIRHSGDEHKSSRDDDDDEDHEDSDESEDESRDDETDEESAESANEDEDHEDSDEDEDSDDDADSDDDGDDAESTANGGGSDGTADSGSGSSGTTPTEPTTPPATEPTTPPVAETPASTAVDGTYTGETVNYKDRFGDIQVAITVAGGKITKVDVVKYPTSPSRTASINAGAISKLESAALAKQSSDVANISGATYTVNGFKQSLQSAITKAGLI